MISFAMIAEDKYREITGLKKEWEIQISDSFRNNLDRRLLILEYKDRKLRVG